MNMAGFTVRLSTASGRVVTVDYGTADGSATVADNDYRAASGTLSFAAGDTVKTVLVPIVGYTKFEADEQFWVRLSNATNALISRAEGAGEIRNEDTLDWAALEGRVSDATNGLALAGVTVNVAGQSVTTDRQGNYLVTGLSGGLKADFEPDVQSGEAPLTVHFTNTTTESGLRVIGSRAGYHSYTNTQVEVRPGQTNRLDFSLAPMDTSSMRLVLNWGKDPQDLDAHLMTPIVEGKQYEVYWGEKGSSSKAPYAQLDVDDRNSFGPETITIARAFSGVYHYFVHNFGDEWTPPTEELTNSAAVVQIYTAMGLIETFHVPTSGEGRFWHVCTVDGTTLAITPINKITNAPDLPGLGIGALSAAWTVSEDGFGRAIIPAMYQAQSARTRYLWNFGDGATSTEDNPTKVYGAFGSYTVSLQVITAQMWADTVIKTNFITVRSSMPVLSINRSGANVAIKWTTGQPRFGLESKASLSAPSWGAIAQVPVVTGNTYTVTLPITGNQFFRLRKP